MGERIVRNCARCRRCDDEIESTHVHDFVTCGCGSLSVDGGLHYLKRLWDPAAGGFDELSEHSDD